MTNPYLDFVKSYGNILREGASCPLGGFTADPSGPEPAPDAPKVLVFSPHPDDECIMGALSLRMLRELGMRIINVAVTQGSNKERQAPRLAELRNACGFLGFEVLTTREGGLEKINMKTRAGDPAHWSSCVEVVVDIIRRNMPRVISIPHNLDANTSHIGTYYLVMDALKEMPADFECFVIQSEFWQPMEKPNLMIEADSHTVSDLVAAISFHVEEVRRNPYHTRLPAWMIDNVRRGGELVGGQGGAAPDFALSRSSDEISESTTAVIICHGLLTINIKVFFRWK